MKKKVKRLYPRRERALRTAGLALALLLFCNGVLHLGFLLPAQADAYAAQRSGVYGPLKTAAAQWKPGMLHKTGRLALLEGENSLSLRYTYWNFYGWEPSFLWPLDTSDGADVHAGVVGMSREGHEEVLVYYGRVRGTDITHLTLDVSVETYDADTDADTLHRHVYAYGKDAEETEQYIKGGYTYFICAVADPVPAEFADLTRRYHIVVNRESGSEDYEVEAVAGVCWG